MNVTFRKAIDDRFLKTFIVEHVVRDANALGNAARIVDVLPSATRTLAMDRSAMVVSLTSHQPRHSLRLGKAAVTDESTPPDMATTTRCLQAGGRDRGCWAWRYLAQVVTKESNGR